MPPRKHSRKRDAIYDCVRSTKTHPSAEWVYTRLKPEIPDLSLGTVPHAHFICTHCGAVIDVDTVDPPEHLIAQVECGAVRECTLTFSGICNSCIRTDAENNHE